MQPCGSPPGESSVGWGLRHGGGDVLALVRVRFLVAEFCTREPDQGFAGYPGQDSIAVIQTGGDEGMGEGLPHSLKVMAFKKI